MKLPFYIILFITLYSCKDDISNKRYRNENYVFVVENEGKGEWRKINHNKKINLPKSYSTYFFSNGNRFAELEVIDSFPNRKIMFFDKENDKHTKSVEYRFDSLVNSEYQNGYNKFYYSNLGNLKSEGLMKNKIRHGKWKFYREDDESIETIAQYINGEPYGLQEEFWSNGNLKNSTTNYKGLLNGKTCHYYENGKIKEKNYLVNGEIHGILTEYFESGKLKSKCKYWFGKEKDTSKFYYENGQLSKLAIIDLDTISGLSFYKTYDYYETGELKSSFESQEIGMNGKIKTYYKNGNIKHKTFLINKKPNGPFISHYEDGIIQLKGVAKNGKLNGNVEYFNEKGELIKTLIVENGISIDSITPRLN